MCTGPTRQDAMDAYDEIAPFLNEDFLEDGEAVEMNFDDDDEGRAAFCPWTEEDECTFLKYLDWIDNLLLSEEPSKTDALDTESFFSESLIESSSNEK